MKHKRLSQCVNDDTVIATNTSNYLPSEFVPVIKNPERFTAIHFAKNIWIGNIAEIMGCGKTSAEITKKVYEFAVSINMVPSVIHNTVAERLKDMIASDKKFYA